MTPQSCLRHGLILAAALVPAATQAAPISRLPVGSKPPVLSTLVQFQAADPWRIQGNVATLGTGIVGAAESSGTINLFSPGATTSAAWTTTTLYRLGSIANDGAYPQGGVVVAGGNIFGSTSGGGNSACANGCGTIFQLTPPTTGTSWTETQLAVFADDNKGYEPFGTVLVSGSTIYGTTAHAANDTTRPGDTGPSGGLVFKLTKPASGSGPWTETVLYHFDAASDDGAIPFGGLITGPGKSLIGTTFQGGACGYGTVFMLTPPATKGGAWTETRLHEFGNDGVGSCDYGDGSLPLGTLTLSSGSLYGTTSQGGNGCGTAFKITLGATPAYQRLYEFNQFSGDACGPTTPLRVTSTGTIWGATSQGGTAPASAECPYGCGTLFTLTPSGGVYTEAVLYSFTGGLDGSYPSTNLLGTPGKTLRGATAYGGFAGDPANPNYASFGTLYQVKN